MKDLEDGTRHTYTWCLTFAKSGDSLGLYHKKDSALLAEIFITNPWVEFILFHLPYGYALWNKVLLWTTTKEELVYSLPATPEMLAQLAPDDAWLWDRESTG